MTQDEFNELKAQVEMVAAGDHHLGLVLSSLLLHLGNLAGVTPTVVAPALALPAQEAENAS